MTVDCLPRELVADHFYVDLLTHIDPNASNKILVYPRLKLTHPVYNENQYGFTILQVEHRDADR